MYRRERDNSFRGKWSFVAGCGDCWDEGGVLAGIGR